jgi:hypothetical protein
MAASAPDDHDELSRQKPAPSANALMFVKTTSTFSRGYLVLLISYFGLTFVYLTIDDYQVAPASSAR